ncbi:hypothetical protein MVEN_01436000 [Mycena venus]|uniref:Uncharacterized protein n=1 Tax=Mycena venus TaxID=2733690 RepID=A0A8H7CVR1_9AGAR|nr:hypothetical protein MVEN_01436000 [Mycena venus]
MSTLPEDTPMLDPPSDNDNDPMTEGSKGRKRRRESTPGSAANGGQPSGGGAGGGLQVGVLGVVQERRQLQAKGKRKGKSYSMPLAKVPERAKGTRVALQLHSRLLTGCLSQNALPRADVKDLIAVFDQRFEGVPNIVDHVEELAQRTAPEMTKALEVHNAAVRELAKGTSRIAAQAVQVDVSHLAMAFGFVAKAGLTASFIFGYFTKLVRKDLRRPGSVEEDNALNPVYSRRLRLGKACYKQLKSEGFRQAVLRLAYEVECHSDDEAAPPQTVTRGVTHLINGKEGHNKQVTTLLRGAQERWNAVCARAGKRIARVGIDRQEDNLPRGPSLVSHKLPKDVPIDFFTPEFFNALTIKEQAMYMDNGIALLLPESFEPVKDWKTLDEKEFMEKFGNKVLELYQLLTEEEIENAMDEDSDDDAGDRST